MEIIFSLLGKKVKILEISHTTQVQNAHNKWNLEKCDRANGNTI
jgi:hypothetical protein